ncbi:putative membrane protein [Streptococcus pneumoniae GA44511]|nr:putative membrane protein [Streptococcus pneumoniae GA44511]
MVVFAMPILGTYLEIKYVFFLFLARNYKQANGLAFRL